MSDFFKRHQQILTYLFWGGATTAVNYTVYFLCSRVLAIAYVNANVIAWALSVLFAFGVNKAFVFDDRNWQPSVVWPELGKFVGARVFSGGLETGLLWLMVEAGGLHDGICKVVLSVVVVLLNYLFSKLFIFRRR